MPWQIQVTYPNKEKHYGVYCHGTNDLTNLRRIVFQVSKQYPERRYRIVSRRRKDLGVGDL